tara:strand:+ start:2491 stop:3198 length:708 start_codon:yes stop_codon:yes gene_type:complete
MDQAAIIAVQGGSASTSFYFSRCQSSGQCKTCVLLLAPNPSNEGRAVVSDTEAEKEFQFAVVEPQDVSSAKFDAFLAHCRALQGDRAMPRWSDFNLHKLPADVIPYVAVADVDGVARTFTYRFWGTGHTALKGVDMTGRKVSEIAAPALAYIGQRQYEMVSEARRPLMFVHALKPYNPWKDEIQATVRVPLSEDGKAVDKVVSYSSCMADKETWADIYWRAVNGGGMTGRHSAVR